MHQLIEVDPHHPAVFDDQPVDRRTIDEADVRFPSEESVPHRAVEQGAAHRERRHTEIGLESVAPALIPHDVTRRERDRPAVDELGSEAGEPAIEEPVAGGQEHVGVAALGYRAPGGRHVGQAVPLHAVTRSTWGLTTRAVTRRAMLARIATAWVVFRWSVAGRSSDSSAPTRRTMVDHPVSGGAGLEGPLRIS